MFICILTFQRVAGDHHGVLEGEDVCGQDPSKCGLDMVQLRSGVSPNALHDSNSTEDQDPATALALAELVKVAPELMKETRASLDWVGDKVAAAIMTILKNLEGQPSPGVFLEGGARVAIMINKKFVNIDSEGWNVPSETMGQVWKGDGEGNLWMDGGFGGASMAWNGYRLNYDTQGRLQTGGDHHPVWFYDHRSSTMWARSEKVIFGGRNNYPLDLAHTVTDNLDLVAPALWIHVK